MVILGQFYNVTFNFLDHALIFTLQNILKSLAAQQLNTDVCTGSQTENAGNHRQRSDKNTNIKVWSVHSEENMTRKIYCTIPKYPELR